MTSRPVVTAFRRFCARWALPKSAPASKLALSTAGALALVAVAALLQAPAIGRADAVAAIQTDKTGYVAGETVAVLGSGFAPFENVTLRVTHASRAKAP